MKKLISILLAITMIFGVCLALGSCSKDDATVRIGVLNGTTGVGIAKLYDEIANQTDDENKRNYEISVYTDVTVITGKLNSGELDIAALPTGDAAKYYNSDAQATSPISMVAINTLSVLYVVTTDESVKSLSDLSGRTVNLPTPEGQGPDVIFRALLKMKGITNVTLENNTKPDALVGKVKQGNADIAVMPEPLVTKATAALANEQKTLYNIVDVGAEWGSENPIAQGCLVARNSFIDEHEGLLEDFLEDYKASVEYMAKPENLDSAAKLVAAMTDLGMIEGVAKKALPKCNLVCITGSEMKNKIAPFYTAILDINENSIGGKLPDEGFYYS